MAKIPLLECLTRNSYRESLERSSSPHPGAGGDERGAQTSPQSAISGPPERQRDQKSPASGESSSPGRAGSGGTSGLQEVLEEEKDQEEMEKNDGPSFNVTLLDWINVQDRPNDVEAVVRKCFDSINRVSARRNVSLRHVFKISSNQSDLRIQQRRVVIEARLDGIKLKRINCPEMRDIVDTDDLFFFLQVVVKVTCITFCDDLHLSLSHVRMRSYFCSLIRGLFSRFSPSAGTLLRNWIIKT